jgi:pSer/pThr/pTyr-binding forkhead associated (FHA) protein
VIEFGQPEVLVGRRSTSSGVDPDVDLAGEPVDVAVSHRHALLVRGEDGTYGVVDLDSTNGTCLNGAETPIEPGVRHLLADGDRIHLGAWTTITLRAGRPERITEEVARR